MNVTNDPEVIFSFEKPVSKASAFHEQRITVPFQLCYKPLLKLNQHVYICNFRDIKLSIEAPQ